MPSGCLAFILPEGAESISVRVVFSGGTAMPTTNANRQPATCAADRGHGSQPGAPSGRPATAPLSVEILALTLKIGNSRNALGVNSDLVFQLGALVAHNAAEVVEALQKVEDAAAKMSPRFPFAWGLTVDERIVLRHLLVNPHLDRSELGLILAGGSESEQRSRKLMFTLRQKLAAVDTRLEIVTVVRQGHHMPQAAKALLLDLMAGRQ